MPACDTMGPRRQCRRRTSNGIDSLSLSLSLGSRQLNAAILRVALTQACCYPSARAMLERRRKDGDGGMEASRILKRRFFVVLFCAMLEDSLTNKIPNAA